MDATTRRDAALDMGGGRGLAGSRAEIEGETRGGLGGAVHRQGLRSLETTAAASSLSSSGAAISRRARYAVTRLCATAPRGAFILSSASLLLRDGGRRLARGDRRSARALGRLARVRQARTAAAQPVCPRVPAPTRRGARRTPTHVARRQAFRSAQDPRSVLALVRHEAPRTSGSPCRRLGTASTGSRSCGRRASYRNDPTVCPPAIAALGSSGRPASPHVSFGSRRGPPPRARLRRRPRSLVGSERRPRIVIAAARDNAMRHGPCAASLTLTAALPPLKRCASRRRACSPARPGTLQNTATASQGAAPAARRHATGREGRYARGRGGAAAIFGSSTA